MNIGEVLQAKGREVHTVGASETVSAVTKRFADSKIRCLVVTERDALRGLVTIRDVLAYIGHHGGDALAQSIEEVMTRDVTSVTPDTSLSEVEALFADKRFSHLPVEENGKLVGARHPGRRVGPAPGVRSERRHPPSRLHIRRLLLTARRRAQSSVDRIAWQCTTSARDSTSPLLAYRLKR